MVMTLGRAVNLGDVGVGTDEVMISLIMEGHLKLPGLKATRCHKPCSDGLFQTCRTGPKSRCLGRSDRGITEGCTLSITASTTLNGNMLEEHWKYCAMRDYYLR